MKLKIVSLAAVLTIAGCSSTPVVNVDEPIRNQKLTTNFTDEGIKIQTNCAWYKPWKSDCDVVAIEATSSAFTNGATAVQVSEAYKIARAEASANVAHFIKEKVTSSRVVTTIAKHIEKATDKMAKNDKGDSEMTDKEAKAINSAVRENSNDTARNVTRTINTYSEAILTGFRTIKQEKVADQTVSVTIRWDLESERVSEKLAKKFGK